MSAINVMRLPKSLSLGELLDVLQQWPGLTVAAASANKQITSLLIDLTPVQTQNDLWQLHEKAQSSGVQAILTVDLNGHAVSVARALQLPVLSLQPGASQSEIHTILHQLGDVDSRSDSPIFTEELALERVATIADRAVELLGGHILVEDEEFRVLAYSQIMGDIDEARKQAILHRQLPSVYQHIFNSQGVQASLLSGVDVIQTEAVPEHGLGPRLVISIRRNQRLVGTIWFARDTPYDSRDIEELQKTADQLSVNIVEALRARRDERIRHDDALYNLLYGVSIPEASNTLETSTINFRRPAHVITIKPIRFDGDRALSIETSGLRVLAEITSRSAHADVLTAMTQEVLYLVHFGCADGGSCEGLASLLLAQQLATSLGRINVQAAIVVGKHAADHTSLKESRLSADRVVNVLSTEQRTTTLTVGQAWAELTIDFFLGNAVNAPDFLPTQLQTHITRDSEQDRELFRTVKTALDYWTNLAYAADVLEVHQNTIRYRLKKFQQVYGIDLQTPKSRLALWMVFEKCYT
ncbi:PucR family transcriptional regulator [Leucobacter chinensis]|uniref:PucR family transcriptional regulator n=1 Tax=Leucobacter chinensis TaxID=2851010 RepID=UPI001C210531|nr:helix-turn-helix domain-containing protein [Leucobacter chinensis]